MSDAKLLYVTAPSPDIASSLANALIEKRAAACVNILPNMQSVYRWDDAIETAQECVLIVKTTNKQIEAARDLILSAHPYETPCILDIEINQTGSNPVFTEWLATCVAPERKDQGTSSNKR